MVLSNGLTSPPPLKFIVQSTQTHLAFSQQIIRNIFEIFFSQPRYREQGARKEFGYMKSAFFLNIKSAHKF